MRAAAMKVVFSTRDVHIRDRVDYWRDEASKVAVAHDFNSRVGRAFEGSISTGTLGALTLTMLEHDASVVRRTDRHIRHGAEDDLLLSLLLDGNLVLHQDGRDAEVGPNDLYIVDSRRPFSLEVGPSLRLLLIKIPRCELQGRLGDISALTARSVTSSEPVASLASGFIAMLPARIDTLDASAGAKVAQHMLDLVALAFGLQLQDAGAALSSSRMTTLLRLKAIIEARLCDPGLRPAHAAGAAGISVRYANALLRYEGMSLERFIMLRRLQHCRRALEDAAQSFRTVSDIAYSYGFSDMSHFTRRFKAQFGCSPSACRQQALLATAVLQQDA
jgi:AraC family transcriptional regulator, positive regulator of tynA and feaB